jgi:flagellar hook-basal body complex protein FliE
MSNTISSGFGGIGGTLPTGATSPSTLEPKEGGGFGSTLHDAIDEVDRLGQQSQDQATDLLKGDRQDIQNVMIAVEKADVAFQLMMQVRNKIVNAYQDISKLQF